ncbi:fibrocystin-L-like [Palaemon carinicauda]|uniref:fibrocystin-L-like n=1 Tax=Palaemon carinicauda TaxID=392227 RepID=UPI0035B68295
MLLWFALFILLFGIINGQVTDVSPYWLGEGGGQTLYIYGQGFSADQFNHFDVNLGNVVRLVNEADTIPCDIINYLTNTERIVCTVRRRENSKAPLAYAVKVFADGTEVESAEIVEFRNWIAPQISSIEPVRALVGTMVTILGYMHTDRYQRMDPEDPLETDFQSGRIITKLYMGGRDCQVYNESSNQPYGYLENRKVSCIPLSKYAGPMNATAYVTERGSSVTSKWSIRVDSQDRLYQHETYPGIFGISPNTGGSTGGTLLTINGVGFDPNPGTTEVKVGGSVCQVQEVTDDIIRCLTPSEDKTGPAAGERGLLWEQWTGVSINSMDDVEAWNQLNSSHVNYKSVVYDDAQFELDITEMTLGKLSGYFHPPHDGDYTFSITVTDGDYKYYTATDGAPENKTSSYDWKRFELKHGSPLYIEIHFRGNVSTEIKMRMNDYHTTWVYDNSLMSYNEKTRLIINPSLKYETQRVSYGNAPGQLSFSLQGIVSSPVNGSDPSEIRTAILSLLEQQCEVLESDPKFIKQADFENSENDDLVGDGYIDATINPFCGRSSKVTHEMYRTLHRETEERYMIDINKYPFACFAIKGFIKDTMRIRYRWYDKSGKARTDDIYFSHGIPLEGDEWRYQCIDMKKAAEESWIQDQRYDGTMLRLNYIFLPDPKTEYDIYNVDFVKFASQQITVRQTRPSALKSYGILVKDVEVERVTGQENAFDIKFKTGNCVGDFPLLGIGASVTNQLVQTLSSAENHNFTTSFGYAYVERTEAASHPVEGTFDMSVEGVSLRDISPNIHPTTFKEMLNNAFGTSTFRVQKRGDCDYASYFFEWLDNPGQKEIPIIDETKLVFDGKPGTIITPRRQDEARNWHDPISGGFFTTRRAEPHVAVTVGGYRSACVTDCSFQYNSNGIPSVSSVTDNFDGMSYTFTISGSGFTSNDLEDYSVDIGPNQCTVTSVTTTELRCTVKHLPAGNHPITVRMQPIGTAIQPNPPLSKSVSVAVTEVSPSSGGTGGGYYLNVTGTGFPANLQGWENNNITVGSALCNIVAATSSSVTCIAPPGSAGSSSIVATVDGTSSAAATFTYDASLSAAISSIAPTAASVLGGDILTITGSGFGSIQDTSVIMVAGKPCEAVSWSDSSIECTLPSLPHGQHPVIVDIKDKGYASGSYKITYTFKVTGSSTTHGSIYGGTHVVIKGAGFGTNCSLLKVNLDEDTDCIISNCTDSEILCEVHLIPKKHVIRNTGSYQPYGVGYAWEPKMLNIREGDTVSWVWTKSDPLSQLVYNVFQTSAPGIREHDKGFTSGDPKSTGSLTMMFPNAQTVYYAGTPVFDDLVMTGQVNVLRPEPGIFRITVTLGGISATVELGGASGNSDFGTGVDSCGATIDTALSSCYINGTTYVPMSPPDNNHLYFATDKCFTPSVTAVSADKSFSLAQLSGLQVSAGVTLTINGTGFGSLSCQNQVKIGDAICTVISATENLIECQLQSQEEMMSIMPYALQLKVVNRGLAMIGVSNYENEGKITVVPVVTSFSPVEGSVAGGTKITISGTGLKAFDGKATVSVGSGACEIKELTSTSIICVTSPNTAGSYAVQVFVSAYSIRAESLVQSSTFTYSSSATPSVTNFAISGENISISGSLFGSDASKVLVTLIRSSTRRKRSSDDKHIASADDYVKIIKKRSTKNEKESKPIFDEEVNDIRYSNIPKVNDDLFDDVKGSNNIWGKFTNTSAMTFEETRTLGVWRVAGSKHSNHTPTVVERIKRQAEEQTSFDCSPTTVTDTAINCYSPGLPAGSYDVSVSIEGLGNADISASAATATVAPVISSITPKEGSINGGALVTISGTGFIPGELSVDIGGTSCVLDMETSTSLTCRTSAHAEGLVNIIVTSGGLQVTASDQYSFTSTKTPVLTSVSPNSDLTSGTTLTLAGSSFMLSSITPEVIIGGLPCVVIGNASDTALSCTSPDLAGGTQKIFVRDSIYGDSNSVNTEYTMSLVSITPSTGGFGGVEVTLNGTGFDPSGGSSVTVCNETCSIPMNVSTSSTMLKCLIPSRMQGGSSTMTCDVIVTNPGGGTATLADGFTYDASITPAITAISPIRGGTAGGTTLTINGTGFAASGNEVSIGGSECKIKSETTNKIICVTEAHESPGKYIVQVAVPNTGIATTDENAEFFYIDRWSSIYTWGGEPVPSQGQLVVIDEGQTILLDESTEVLKMLLIKGGHVIVDPEATEEIILRAEYILIVEGGSLSIGSEEEPYTGKAVIELYGNALSIELPSYGAKVLAVRNGSLDLHGMPIPQTWTYLASTAAKGSNEITLKHPVTWKKGDTIIIATTEKRFSNNENEKRIIDEVSADGRTLTLTEALKYEHISIEQTLGGRIVETRAEVGLLSRNIKIRGNINEAFQEVIEACDEKWNPGQFETQSCFNGRFGEEIGSDQFGATVMIFGKSKDYGLVHGRIEYVEVTEAGQAFQLGRYPLHFHLVGNVNSSYVRGCAIHRTYNRAVTIHAADYLTVERNVAYDNMGHAIFTEDGNEMHNIIQYNLAIYTRTSASLLNVDVTPSSFWVVNPNNIVRHNAAAGGTHFGYWYRLERYPSGPSSTNSYCQNNEVMGMFYNNTAHSMGRYGLWIFSMDGYFPKSGVCSGSNLVAAWHDFTVWHCDRGAEVVLGGALQFHNFVALDNEHAGLEMVKVSGGFGENNGPGIFNSLLVGHSQLSPEGCGADTSGIIAPKQYIFSISNTTFVNYDAGTCAALSGCSQCKEFQGGYRVQVKELVFENSPNKLKFLWEHETIWIDADGSLSGVAENVVVPTMDILPTDTCQKDVPEFSVNTAAKGSVCSPPMKFMRMHLPGSTVNPKSLEARDLVVTTTYGNTSLPYRVKRLDRGAGWMGIFYSGATFKWGFDYSEQITNLSYTAYSDFIDSEDHYYVEHSFVQTPDGFGTTGSLKNSSLSIPDPTTGVHGDFYWNTATKTMTYLVKLKTSKRKRRTVFDARPTGRQRNIKFEVYRCFYDGCAPPTGLPPTIPEVTLKWSDVNTWKEVPVGTGGHPSESVFYIPTVGESITVPAGMRLIVDTDTPPLGRIYVYGTLEFEDSMNHTFECTIMFIKGGRVVAGETEDAPFNHDLSITLRGTTNPSDPDNEDLVMPYGVPNVGWKAIGVFGLLNLHGRGSVHSWIKLASTAVPGDDQINLSQTPDSYWLNREVMITTTGKEASETEIRKVVAIIGNALTLDSPLQYEHLGVTHEVDDGTSYTMSAEVGLLGRNIIIQGSATDNSFGGRILVSQVTTEGQTYKGSAKLSNVEFRKMGQEGFTDSDDPRYTLAFHGLGDNDGGSYVKHCSFNTNYNTAIGFFSSNGISTEGNVVYHTVGGSIIDQSVGNIFKNNLISLMLFPGTYNGRNEIQNFKFFGGFVLNDASKTVLEGNVVAGTEQAGFQTYGEPCEDESLWSNNEVHNAMFGILLWKKGSVPEHTDCRRVKGFTAWRVWDTAFYMQHYASLILSDVKSIDNYVGVHQLVYGPHALSHQFYEKTARVENAIFVGASPSHTCEYHDSTVRIMEHFTNSLWKHGVDGGNSGILFASFQSGINMAPKHSFHEAASYPAIRGGSYINNVQFVNYNNRICGKDIALRTNKESDDAIHPVFVSAITFVNSSTDNYIFMNKPNLGKVNPSDCVDMSCDGHKKVVIQDMDGSVLGTVNATAIAMAEYEWDGDRSHGVGDYRIPVPLRMRTDGSAITAAEKYPNKGIFRDNTCTMESSWRAWKCRDIAHRMMVIESMDPDTEIRRLSPIGLIGNPGSNGYVDLLNGPMDRGWCFGYTCQERISTFYSVVAPGQEYEMAMKSTPPQVLRLQLLHSDPSERIVLRLFYPKMQRYDIYVDDVYVPPKNIDKSKYPGKYELMSDSDSNSAYIPQLTDPAGSNFLQRNAKFLHIVLHGGHLYEIKTMPTVVLNMGITVDPDNFFEEDVVNNMALLLGVAPENIRVTNIIREDSGGRRKKRNTVIYQFEFEISSPPTATANASVSVAVNGSSAEVLAYEDLLDVIVKAVDNFQAGKCENCNITIARLQIIEPLPPPKNPPPTATEETGSVIVPNGTLFSDIQQVLDEANLNVSLQSVTYEQPSDARLEQDVPQEVTAFTVFPTQPIYNVLSSNGSVIQSLGHTSNPWIVTATLVGGPPDATLLGATQVPYLSGAANFTNLSINKPGTGYIITFNVTSPSEAPALPVLGNTFNATEKRVQLELINKPDAVMPDEIFNITLQITDLDNGLLMDSSPLEGQQMSGTVELVSGGNAQVGGNTSFTISGGNMASFTLDLSFSQLASAYIINITATVEPAGWTLQTSISISGRSEQSTPYDIRVTLVGHKAANNLTGNESEFAGLLKDILERVGQTGVNWSVTVSIRQDLKPFADIHASGEKNAVTDSVTALCKSVSGREIKVVFQSVSYTMQDMNIYDQGVHRKCPAKLNTHILIQIIQNVHGIGGNCGN